MPPASRRYVAAVVAVVLTCDVGLLLGGHHPWSGPEIIGLTHTHGLHATDPLLLTLWAVALACCWHWAHHSASSPVEQPASSNPSSLVE